MTNPVSATLNDCFVQICGFSLSAKGIIDPQTTGEIVVENHMCNKPAELNKDRFQRIGVFGSHSNFHLIMHSY